MYFIVSTAVYVPATVRSLPFPPSLRATENLMAYDVHLQIMLMLDHLHR